MKNIVKITLLTLVVSIASCADDQPTLSVAEKPELKILILGNSIVKHSPAPSLGWYGDWGMAATAPDRDFVHVFSDKLSRWDKFQVSVESQNIAYWENDFSYELDQFPEVFGKSYDLIIVRLGENVSDTDHYEQALTDMVAQFKTDADQPVIITGVVWPDDAKEVIHRQVAQTNSYLYIPFDEFRSNSNNYSWGLYENGALAAHPSDLGMAEIASLLYEATVSFYD